MYEERLPLNAVILGSLSGGIALGTPFSPFLTPTWALLIGCLSGFLVAIWIKVTARLQHECAAITRGLIFGFRWCSPSSTRTSPTRCMVWN